jgi:hypothetical protein
MRCRTRRSTRFAVAVNACAEPLAFLGQTCELPAALELFTSAYGLHFTEDVQMPSVHYFVNTLAKGETLYGTAHLFHSLDCSILT